MTFLVALATLDKRAPNACAFVTFALNALLVFAVSDEAFENNARIELSDWFGMTLLTLCVAFATFQLMADTNVLNDCMYEPLRQSLVFELAEASVKNG